MNYLMQANNEAACKQQPVPTWRRKPARKAFLRVAIAVAIIACFLSASGFSGFSADQNSGRPVKGRAKHTLILVSLDGFRWDYLNRGESPNINRLAAEGVRAESMIPVFPSETFPNHYSIVTGVYPEKHGIVKNAMYDPQFNATFIMSRDAGESRWWGAEPIWVTVQKQGQKSAIFFWPGSEAEIEGTRPAYWKKYDRTVPNSKRVVQALKWLDLPSDKRPSFIALYFSDVDNAGHGYGPDSGKVNDAIKTVDKSIGALVKGLKARDLTDSTDIIVVSDHGMTATNTMQRVYVPDYVNRSILESGHSFGGANALIWPVAGK